MKCANLEEWNSEIQFFILRILNRHFFKANNLNCATFTYNPICLFFVKII
jgi:hypothetical protein